MKNLLFSFLAIILISFAVQAQSSSSTVSNSTGKQIQDVENGFSFRSPKDWENQQAEGSYVLSNSSKTAAIIVKSHNYKDFDSFVAAEVNLESEGYKLAGEVRDLGNGNRFARIYNSSRIIDAFFLLSSYNGGLIILSVTDNAKTADLAFYVASEIVESVQFSRPQQSAQSSQIQAAFAGKKLSYYYTGNGYFEQRTIWLCPSGSYFSKSETGSSSAIGSGSTYSEDQGSWRIQTSGNSAYLVLNSNIGKGQRNFTITARQAGNEIGLNNARYFVEAHNQCR